MHLKLPKIPRVRSRPVRGRRKVVYVIRSGRHRPEPEPPAAAGLLNGLVAYWKLDEDTGQVRMDSSGNDLHLTDNNYASLEPGFKNGAAGFAYDDCNRWLDHANDPLLRFQGDFTLSLWIYRTGSVFGWDVILAKTNSLCLSVHQVNSFRIGLDLTDENSESLVEYLSFTGNTIIQENQWYHVVVYRSGYTYGIVTNADTPAERYVEGEPNPTGTFFIGAFEAGFPFTGLIDEVGKWNRALSAEEIAALYNNGDGLAFEEF